MDRDRHRVAKVKRATEQHTGEADQKSKGNIQTFGAGQNQRGKPDRFRVETLVPGWREGVQAMVVGEKRRLWIPERLAFGPVPTPGRPNGDIVLDVELLKIVAAPDAPEVPSDLTAPPDDARSTASGFRISSESRASISAPRSRA